MTTAAVSSAVGLGGVAVGPLNSADANTNITKPLDCPVPKEIHDLANNIKEQIKAHRRFADELSSNNMKQLTSIEQYTKLISKGIVDGFRSVQKSIGDAKALKSSSRQVIENSTKL
ncbi:unnamed protein product [Soboliphyme baturini]|uniref:Secreted protein n=1 Tax=Soboliphyme baturini TaxID=241478 RepID=A0A183IFR6_9BILA|nr:unnamed protein product [Soboliphyme baturini]